MRWLSFAIIALLGVVLHTTVAPRLALFGAGPDWLIVAVVFFAMHVRGLDCLIAAWLLGMVADLQSLERIGMMSLAYTGAAAAVMVIREHFFRFHPLTHFAMTLMACLVVQALVMIFYLLPGAGGGPPLAGRFGATVVSAAYSAAWAPLFHALMLNVAPWLGLQMPRYSHARLARRI